jgi:hypothetical protein
MFNSETSKYRFDRLNNFITSINIFQLVTNSNMDDIGN